MKYILGSGLAGLIFKFYHPEYQIISSDKVIGGQVTQGNSVPYILLIHDTPETRQLMVDLKIPLKFKRIDIRYYYNGEMLDTVAGKIRQKFIQTKMTEYNYDCNSVDIADTKLSVDDNFIDIIDVDIREVIRKLTPESYITARVKLVNNNRQFMLLDHGKGKVEVVYYDRVISTIPANMFFPMMYNFKHSYQFTYLPVTYIIVDELPYWADPETMYYVYNPELPYNRFAKVADGLWSYAITGLPTIEEIKEHFINHVSIERRYTGVIRSEEVGDLRNIKFLGRFAQWQHHIKIQNVISKAKSLK